MSKHPAKIYRSLKEYLEDCVDTDSARRSFIIKWKKWKSRHKGSPLITKCSICSGKEFKNDVKHGRWRISKRKNEMKDYE